MSEEAVTNTTTATPDAPAAVPDPAPDPAPAPPAPPPGGAMDFEPRNQNTEPPQHQTTDATNFWQTPLPAEGIPSPFASYQGKSLSEIANAHKELQTRLGRSQSDLKTAQQEALAKQQELEDFKTSQANGKPDVAKWQSGLSGYYETGSIDEDTLNSLADSVGLPASEVANFFEYKRGQREAYFNKIRSEYDGVDPRTLELWLQSGESTFTREEGAGFQALAARGDTSWVATVSKAYNDYVNAGNYFTDPNTGRPYGAPPPQRQGRPAGGDYRGFQTADEYLDAFSKARDTGDQAEVDKVIRLLEETPESVKRDWPI